MSAGPTAASEPDPRRRVLRPYGTYSFSDFPFPHVRSVPSLPLEQYEALRRSVPPAEAFSAGRTAARGPRFEVDSSRVLGDPAINDEWKWLVAQHTEPTFWLQVLERFGAQLHAGFSAVEQHLGRPMARWRVARLGSGEPADLHLECRLVMETAAATRRVRRQAPHVEPSNTIWCGRLDLLGEEQESAGADLQLFRALPDLRYDADRAPRGGVIHEVTVPAEPNRFLGFVNGPQAIHAIGPRVSSSAPLYYVEFLAQMDRATFELPQMNALKRRWNRLLDRPARG